MSKTSEGRRLWERRRKRTRRQLARSTRPLLTCYRSTKHIYAQIVEAETGKTLLTVSSRSVSVPEGSDTAGKKGAARAVGLEIAKQALERDIRAVSFNRNGFVYHGRVKALADGAREGGLSL